MKYVIVLMALLWAAPASAHKLKLFVTQEGGDMVGTAYFAGGGPAAQIGGTVMVNGTETARFRTDAEGNFRVTAPANGVISVDAGDGHVASANAAAMVEPPTNDVEAAVARQIRPLRLQMDAMEERARFSDIMGGIGTIFGLFGIAAWLAAKRRGKQ
jgi:nickel transport protein